MYDLNKSSSTLLKKNEEPEGRRYKSPSLRVLTRLTRGKIYLLEFRNAGLNAEGRVGRMAGLSAETGSRGAAVLPVIELVWSGRLEY
jgi:hypothetical protein